MKVCKRALAPFVAALMLALTAAGCHSNSTTSTTTTPTAPTPTVPLVTETFKGTVPVGGSDFHTFTVSQTGEVDVTLTAAGPPSTIAESLGVGTLSDPTTCTPAAGSTLTTQAGSMPQLAGSSVAAGTLCIQVSDAGNQTAPITYTVVVAHP